MDTAVGSAAGGPDGPGDITSISKITEEGLREVFPLWRIFSHDGTWWAVRGGWQPYTGPRSLIMRTHSASDLTALAERLCIQEWLDGLDDAALEDVYQHELVASDS